MLVVEARQSAIYADLTNMFLSVVDGVQLGRQQFLLDLTSPAVRSAFHEEHSRNGNGKGTPHSRYPLMHLQRAIGVLYKPETELRSHYFRTRVCRQYDVCLYFDSTRALAALDRAEPPALEMEGFPTGL